MAASGGGRGDFVMSVYEAVTQLLGDPPAGLEPVAYFLSAAVLMFILSSAFGLLSVIIRGK